MIYVLDACAMIAFLGGETGAGVVESALLEAGSQCLAHSINLWKSSMLSGGKAARWRLRMRWTI
jgi:hypothetical protein